MVRFACNLYNFCISLKHCKVFVTLLTTWFSNKLCVKFCFFQKSFIKKPLKIPRHFKLWHPTSFCSSRRNHPGASAWWRSCGSSRPWWTGSCRPSCFSRAAWARSSCPPSKRPRPWRSRSWNPWRRTRTRWGCSKRWSRRAAGPRSQGRRLRRWTGRKSRNASTASSSGRVSSRLRRVSPK